MPDENSASGDSLEEAEKVAFGVYSSHANAHIISDNISQISLKIIFQPKRS